ncbi:hypothetical protein [Flavobacterium geliluteum]|uniref:DUF4377 domain-containing protein n=1 Tax=Flavobacterium geliluteum TaxID=2816120 RepID=A0A940XAL0_9FLAO|nr:hypothetical protein [Flavobacterium geliluteum]MBP4138441.1 hypothetical protein [Flavobacterium geliluteum]
MKKILTLFAVVGLFAFSSCSNDDVDNDTISEVFERTVTFSAANNYSALISLNPAIFTSDMVLVYRLTGFDNGQDVWKLVPETYYFPDGTLSFGYEYDFTINDVSINMFGYDLATVPGGNKVNQIFRVVIVPGYVSTNKSVNKTDYSDYYAVIKKYNLDDTNIKRSK